ncbi:MAG: hypothetical protein J5884_06195 [Paludibacteraceae bacterium]|nr:hypothetical protein [Paludibacteraceae bacterium]
MRINKNILPISLLVFSLCYTLWYVFAGFGNHQDPLYWLYKYEHLEGGWMAVGTLLTGGALVRLFGTQLLPLRIAGWVCVVTAILLPYCALLTKEQRRHPLNLLALPITFALLGYGAFQEFSPGTLTVLLLSLLWVTKSPVVLGLAVAVRFPNILALLIMMLVWKKRSLTNIPIAALTAGLVYLLGYWFIAPAPLDAAMSSHDLWPMVTKLWENGGKLVGYILMAVGVLAIGNIEKTVKGIDIRVVMGFIVGGLLLYFIAYAIKPMQWYNTDLTYLLSALMLVLAVGSKQKELYIGAAIMIVATLGTDTAWLKLFPAVLCLLPVALALYELKKKAYWMLVLSVLAVIVSMRMFHNSVGQSDLGRVDTFSSVAPYKGIAIREKEEQHMLQYKTDVDSLRSPILALGKEMHLMRAVTGCEAARFNEFWSNIYDSVYTARYREIIQNEHPVVFCSYSPQFKTKPEYQDRESRMEQMLREEGYCEIDRSKYKYMIYVYDQEIQ